MSRVLCAVALWASLVACGSDKSFPPPPQRTPLKHPKAHVSAMLSMGGDQGELAWGSIVGDVDSPVPNGDWRWAHAHPSFRIDLMDFDGWKAAARITVVGKVLAAMGPQQVAMSVNGSPVGKTTFSSAGTYELAFPVDPRILKSASPIVLRLDIDPCLQSDSPAEKPKPFCILLHSAGFIRDIQ